MVWTGFSQFGVIRTVRELIIFPSETAAKQETLLQASPKEHTQVFIDDLGGFTDTHTDVTGQCVGFASLVRRWADGLKKRI